MNSFSELIAQTRSRAYAGDVNYGALLISQSPNRVRGNEVSKAFASRIPTTTFREMLGAAWSLDHHEVRKAAHNDRILKQWFEYAAFDVSHLPEHLTFYRGGMCFSIDEVPHQTPVSLCWGQSWTLDRDAACFFATIYAHRTRPSRITGAYPCVVAIRVPRRYALANFTDRRENEVVAFTRRLRRHIIDGENIPVAKATIASWRPSEELFAEWLAAGERFLAAHSTLPAPDT